MLLGFHRDRVGGGHGIGGPRNAPHRNLGRSVCACGNVLIHVIKEAYLESEFVVL